LNRLVGRKVHATDGDLGHVNAFFFDDATWSVRYMVVETGNWLFDRKVLIAPSAISKIGWDSDEISVTITREQVRTSPDVDTEKPVSRQQEIELSRHYVWPGYWGGGLGLGTYGPSGLYGVSAMPLPIAIDAAAANDVPDDGPEEDPHLVNSVRVSDYRIQTTDGEMGNVNDFILDDANWSLRYMVIDTGHLLPGRKVAISPEQIDRIDSFSGEVFVTVSRETLEKAPEYDPSREMSDMDVLNVGIHFGDKGAFLG
jgi:hypothetical protein